MSTCTVKERLQNFAIGLGLAVVLLTICWGAVMFTWAAK